MNTGVGACVATSEFGPRVHPFPTIPTRSSTHDALVKRFMYSNLKTVGKVDSGASSGAAGWKDILQLLREQSEKMEKLARALSVIQQGMLRNNPGHVKDSVNEASEVLNGMLNTHKTLLESGVEIQKKLESHPASKKMVIFRRLRSASLGDTPEKLTKGEKRVAPSSPEDRLPKKGKGGISPSHAAATRGQTPKKDGEWQLVERRKRKKREEEERGSCALCAGT